MCLANLITCLVYPNSLIVNSKIENSFWPHFGIDLIVFKISKKKAIFLKEIIKSYDQYDWGVIENFYISIAEALNLKIHNLFKKVNLNAFSRSPNIIKFSAHNMQVLGDIVTDKSEELKACLIKFASLIILGSLLANLLFFFPIFCLI